MTVKLQKKIGLVKKKLSTAICSIVINDVWKVSESMEVTIARIQ